MADETNAPYVVLMGSVSSGKSSLIASMRKCAEEGTHGLSHGVRARIREDEEAFDERNRDAWLGEGLSFASEFIEQRRLTSLENDFFDRDEFFGQSTVETVIHVYPLRVSFTRRNSRASVGRLATPAKVRLIDAAGGVILPTEKQRREWATGANPEVMAVRQRAYRQLVERAQGVIFCLDITSDDADEWRSSFSEMEEVLAMFPDDTMRRRIAITFTKTEYLFSIDGRFAMLNALRRDVIRPRISRALNVTASEILQRWSELEVALRGRFDVRCFPTSTYGYLRHNGCANYSHANDQWLIGERKLKEDVGVLSDASAPPPDIEEIGGRYARWWRPVMTIDPLIYAAFGDQEEMRSSFMFKISDFVDLPTDYDDEQDARKNARKKPWWQIGR